MDKWLIALNYCREKGIPPEWIINPKDFKSHQQSAARKAVIKELRKKGFSYKEIKIVCPVNDRTISRVNKNLGLKEARKAEGVETQIAPTLNPLNKCLTIPSASVIERA